MGKFIVEVEGLAENVSVTDETPAAVIQFISKVYRDRQWNLYQSIRGRGIVWLQSGMGQQILRRARQNENDIAAGIDALRHQPLKF